MKRELSFLSIGIPIARPFHTFVIMTLSYGYPDFPDSTGCFIPAISLISYW
ncbi:MAG TPA: hypothetical protein VFC65_01565 [Prolixibacteraceae bacterium]|nr:hypothetical protein [Prolixibacteraceae bacterium]